MDEKKNEATPPAPTAPPAPPKTAKYIPGVDCLVGGRFCLAGSPIEVPYSTEPRKSWTPIDAAAEQRFAEAGIRPAPHGSHLSPEKPKE